METEGNSSESNAAASINYGSFNFGWVAGRGGSGFHCEFNKEKYDICEVSKDGNALIDIHPAGDNLEEILISKPLSERFTTTATAGVLGPSIYVTALIKGIVEAVSTWLEGNYEYPHNHLYKAVNYHVRGPYYVRSARWRVDGFITTNKIQNVIDDEHECPISFDVSIVRADQNDEEIKPLSALRRLIFDVILGGTYHLPYTWLHFSGILRDLETVQSITNTGWRRLTGHSCFMSWKDKRAVILQLYRWFFHTKEHVTMPDLVRKAFANVKEVQTWVAIIKMEQGPLYSVLTDPSRVNSPYHSYDVKLFVQYLRNLCHLIDRWNNGSYKHINIGNPDELPYELESFTYHKLTAIFPTLFPEVIDALILANAPPFGY